MPLGKLPAQRAAAPANRNSSPDGAYTVKSGDSLWAIANKKGITVAQLQSANDMTGTGLQPGQKLVIPGEAGSQAPVQVAAAPANTMTDARRPNPAPSSEKTAPKHVAAVQPQNDAVSAPQADSKPAKPLAPSTATKDVKSAEPIKTASANPSGFRWPVQGRVISGFGKKANGERNDGIDLAVPEGTSVKAAESGVVIYAGNELKSYGNLVLVRHENGWVSAYAHNKELLVKRGDQVQRGQVISRAGMTGGVDTPKVHFELRKGATPVDPMKYLSAV